MNWNNTQFDRKFPITIDCSRNVGEILKYVSPEQKPQIKYSFYIFNNINFLNPQR